MGKRDRAGLSQDGVQPGSSFHLIHRELMNWTTELVLTQGKGPAFSHWPHVP